MNCHRVLIGIILVLMLIGIGSAGIFVSDDAKTTIAIKTINKYGTISQHEVKETDLSLVAAQTVLIELTKTGKLTQKKTMQIYPLPSIQISSDFSGTTNTMQRTATNGYPLLEVYYGYQKTTKIPWEYYFRVEKIDDNYAYIIFGNFYDKSVALNKISRASYDTILHDGKIPDWITINDMVIV